MTYVRPYVKQDGTHVRGHFRNNPDSSGSSLGGPGPIIIGVGLIFAGLVGGGVAINKTGLGQSGDENVWKTAGFTVTRITSSDSGSCESHSYGQLPGFFKQHECVSLHRGLFQAEDDKKNSALIATSRTEMPNRTEAGALRRIVDRHGAGNISELSAETFRYSDVSFTGENYDSDIRGSTVLVAEAEPVAGNIDSAALQNLAERAIKHQ